MIKGENIIVWALALNLGIVSIAKADISWNRYNDLMNGIVNSGEKLNDVKYEISEIEKRKLDIEDKIQNKEQKIKENRVFLSKAIKEEYKESKDFIDLFLNVDDLNKVVSNIYYAGKVDKAVFKYLDEIERDKADLEKERTDLKNIEIELKKKNEEERECVAVVEGWDKEKEEYFDSLSIEEKEDIKEKEIKDIEVGKEKIQLENEEQKVVDKEENKEIEKDIEEDEKVEIEESKVEENREVDKEEKSKEEENKEIEESKEVEEDSPIVSSDVKGKILEAAYSQLGVPYVYGASAEGEAFDCSGLTSWAYGQAGIELPHSSAAQAAMLENGVKDSSELEAGDLVFYIGNADGSQSGNHVAIYAGNGQVIHANGSLVTVSDMNDSWTSAGSLV